MDKSGALSCMSHNEVNLAAFHRHKILNPASHRVAAELLTVTQPSPAILKCFETKNKVENVPFNFASLCGENGTKCFNCQF